MTRPQANRGNNSALMIGTLVAAALIALALFAGRGKNDAAADTNAEAVTFNLANKPMEGQESAPVSMVVVEDFKCPACKQFEEDVFPRLHSEYVETGKVKVHSIIWPFLAELAKLPENDSKYAAMAAECVYENDGAEAFSKYRTIVFRAQGAESEVWATKNRLKELAANVEGIDQAAFGTCLDEEKTSQRVDDNEKEVLDNGVTGTPSIFVNGKKVDANYDSIKAAIDGASGAPAGEGQ